MSGYYAANPHYAAPDYTEERERRERADFEGGRWFNELTKDQQAAFNQRMADIRPYSGSPRWERMRDAALRTFADTTKEAAAVCEMVVRDMLADGEISEATSYAYDRVAEGGTAAEPAPVTEPEAFDNVVSIVRDAMQEAAE